MKFTPLHVHSHYSILDGLSTPKQIVDRCIELGYNACALTDHGSVSGCVDLVKQCQKKDIKPILGLEAYVATGLAQDQSKESKNVHQVILARNLKGWHKLIQLVSKSNDPDVFYYKPRIDLNIMGEICDDDLISFSGHPGSTLYNILKRGEEPDLYLKKMLDIFGKNFFIEIQLIETSPDVRQIAEELRNIAEHWNITPIATCDAHYATPDQSIDHQALLCSSLKTTLKKVKEQIENNQQMGLDSFFRLQRFHIPSPEEMLEYGNTKEEIENTQIINEKCEEYNILGPPSLPKFKWTEGKTEEAYLIGLCREGWKKIAKPDWNKQVYGDRVKHELSVINESGLAGYFLIVQDYVNWAKNQGILVGVSRGCLSPDTKLICKNGKLVSIKDIKVNDKVYTSSGLLNVVKHTYRYKCNEQLLNIRTHFGTYDGITVTSDHKILAEKAKLVPNYNKWQKSTQQSKKKYLKPTGNLQWVHAEKIQAGDWLVIPKIKQHDIDEITKIDLSKYCNTNDLRFDNNYVYFEPKNKLCKCNMFSRKINRYINLNNDFIKIIGIFCGDGWIHNNAICFAFNSNEIKEKNNLIQFFTKLGCKIGEHKHKHKQLIQIYIYHKVLVKLFQHLFCDYKKSSKTKHVPQLIFNLDLEKIKSFLHGYLSADGYIDNSQITFTTISEKLATQIRFLCLLIGVPASICIEDRIGQKNITHLSYIINCPLSLIDKKCKQFNHIDMGEYILVRVKSVATIDNKSNYVYDIEVKNEHNYLTTNGIVHNSAGGSLVSYLLGITGLDPIKHGLIFERFYNKGRNTEGHVSLPDIDIDFPVNHRERVVDYIRKKYGENHVAQMTTFNKLMGRGALKEVLRVHSACDFPTMNQITKSLPHEHEIADQLEATGEDSIIQYVLKHDPDLIKDYCRLEDGEYRGNYGSYFAQAARIEGTIKSTGRHAAGVMIAAKDLNVSCPMVRDKNSDKKICGFDMYGCEDIGLGIKADILGLLMLDRLMGINSLLQNGKINAN